MSDLKYSRDLTPDSFLEFSANPAAQAPQGRENIGAPPVPDYMGDKSEDPLDSLVRRIRPRAPHRTVCGYLPLTAAGGALALLPGPLQTGIIVAVNATLTGASATAAVAVPFSLMSNYNEVYFQSTVLVPVTASPLVFVNLVNFDALYVNFRQGLQMVAGACGAGAAGAFAIQVVWTQ